MDKKYTSSHQMGDYPKFVIAIILSFFPLLGLTLAFSAFFVAYSTYANEGYPIEYALTIFGFIMLVAGFFCYLGWILIANGLAKYTFTDVGLVAKYPMKKELVIPWEEFQQVCVCHAAYTTRGTPRANTVICCVKKGENTNGLGRWKTDNPFRYRSVICIDFQNSLLKGLIEKYPGVVVDLRDTPEYRLKR